MGRTRPAQVHGLLLVDKRQGVTSFDVVARIRKRLDVRQVGHGGTLDPMATGLLPILVGEATKLTPWLMGLSKVYEATVRLGAATDTYDAEGRITLEAPSEAVTALSEAQVREAVTRFVGVIQQRPPAFAAIKKDGVRMYERARAGEDIEMEPRPVVIHDITLARFAPPEVDLVVHCGKGTYIRSIAHDVGEALGVHGHLTALRRTRIGNFSVAEAVDPFAPESELRLLPLERAVDHLASLTLDAESVRRLRMGQQHVLQALVAPPSPRPAVRLLDEKQRLVAVAEVAPATGQLVLGRVFPPLSEGHE